MICKNCGAIIKYKEEYCRKCGSLVINFNQDINKNLRDLCIENNIRGKIQSFINRISNKEGKARKMKYNYNNNHNVNKNKLGSLGNNNSGIEEIINLIKDNLKI